MDYLRRQALQDSLERELELESRRRNLGPRERVAWVVEHVEEYLDRVLGFAALPDLSMQSLVSGDLWGMMEIGSELLTRELHHANAPAHAAAAWSAFLLRLAEVRDAGDKEQTEQLMDAFKAACAPFLTTLGKAGKNKDG